MLQYKPEQWGFFMAKKGYLVLENGEIFEGESFGKVIQVSGEIVFNTGMVGYPEGFTDPSYYGQILVLTYPLVGNYGIPPESTDLSNPIYFESYKAHIRGLIVSQYVENNTHWQSKKSLGRWLEEEDIPALTGIDTRTLTKILRQKGVMKGIITFKKNKNKLQRKELNFLDINKDNLVASVSCSKPIIYKGGKKKVMLIDCGVKQSQIRMLTSLGATVLRVPWNFDPLFQKNNYEFDALMISNGPGDPKMANEVVKTVKKVIEREIPILGVCLGNQILARAAGAKTYKLKYGHRSQNQPVQDITTGKCYITTQNHGFSVDIDTLPPSWESWFVNLNDKTDEGIKHKKLPFLSTQFHPEACPGPTDTSWVFDRFLSLI